MFDAIGHTQQAAHTLHESAVAARKAGHLTQAMAAAHELTSSHATSGTVVTSILTPLCWQHPQNAV